ncbi:unnamed protein product [Lampetra fluviatilis]
MWALGVRIVELLSSVTALVGQLEWRPGLDFWEKRGTVSTESLLGSAHQAAPSSALPASVPLDSKAAQLNSELSKKRATVPGLMSLTLKRLTEAEEASHGNSAKRQSVNEKLAELESGNPWKPGERAKLQGPQRDSVPPSAGSQGLMPMAPPIFVTGGMAPRWAILGLPGPYEGPATRIRSKMVRFR